MKHIDFHFALALVTIMGIAGFLSLQLSEANSEFNTLSNASMYSVIQNRGDDLRENISINQELDELGESLDALILN